MTSRRLGRMPGIRQLPSAAAKVDRKIVLFESWHGSFSDSPRAISEELHRRGTDHEHVWAISPGNEPPSWAEAVAPEGRAYLSYLRRAGYVVSNTTMPGYFRKPETTRYLQTWHGTPLKRIGFDMEHRSLANRPRELRRLARDVARWDGLVSPNRFSTDIFRQAFRYSGNILETGYPRNDLLSDPREDAIRARVRDELGIPPSARAVLYAPTWRDSFGFSLALRTGDLLGALEDDYLLVRLHHLVADAPIEPHPRLRDVSAHTDNRELFLAADVLVTDYSSVMFDFAITGKPMLFFVYDLASYRDELRGFYFDFEREAPGPLLEDTGQVIEALADLEAAAGRSADAYDRFRRRYCSLEDGKATARVIDAFFD